MVALTSRREGGTTLAVFRILVSLVALFSLLSVATAGLLDVLWVDPAHGGMASGPQHFLTRILGGATPGVAWVLWTTAFLSALALLAGSFGRLSALVLLQCYYALVASNPNASGGYDSMILNALWMLVLGNATATLSVDCKVRHGAFTSDESVAAWPRLALVWQLVIVYFFTGIQKVGTAWTPFGGYTALYYVSQDPTWTRFGGGALGTYLLPLTRIGTAVTWHWEQSAILLLLVFYYRSTRERGGRLRRAFNRFDLRLPWAAVGVVMHLGILLMLNVGPFSPIALSFYVCLFTPDEVRGALTRLRWLSRTRDPGKRLSSARSGRGAVR